MMKTLLEVLQLSTQFLEKKGIDNARREAEDLVAGVFNLPRLRLYTDFDRPLTEDELSLAREQITRRGKKEPIQYILGKVDFLGCEIQVDKRVLIPRQETEILADKIVKSLQLLNLNNKVFWDVCTGSGCLAIAIKKKFPELKVVASDISEDSINLAKLNAEKNTVDIEFRLGDFLEPFAGEKTDFFVCNPPYIAAHEFESLEVEVKDYEPIRALISGPTGLEFYERLQRDLKKYLQPKAKVFLEIGNSQGQAVFNLFEGFTNTLCVIEKDWSGQDRFFLLENE